MVIKPLKKNEVLFCSQTIFVISNEPTQNITDSNIRPILTS